MNIWKCHLCHLESIPQGLNITLNISDVSNTLLPRNSYRATDTKLKVISLLHGLSSFFFTAVIYFTAIWNHCVISQLSLYLFWNRFVTSQLYLRCCIFVAVSSWDRCSVQLGQVSILDPCKGHGAGCHCRNYSDY